MKLRLEDYKVGWITALPIEAAAAKAMFDDIHPRLSSPDQDSNIYTFGYISPGHGESHGGHNVVIASGRPGTATAATVANDMRRTFPWLRIALMVGIAGGVWSPDTDVRLGDIVVGVHPSGEAGVIQYDYGKQVQDRDFTKTTAMNKAPAILLNAVAAVQADHLGLEPPERAYVSHLDREQARRFSKRPIRDRLFNATYLHQAGSCEDCDERQLRDRTTRGHPTIPRIHYGPIASGNRVIRDAVFAEKIRMKFGSLCFEMEAAGLDNFPSLTIRGISDYCDTHKSDEWHQYAAISAAAYAKELLSVVPPTAIVQLPQLGNIYWNVPRAPNPLFTGRQSLLEDMKKHLVNRTQKNDRPVFVLQGIGGAGKSEAAIKFAMENQDNFWGIFWIDADNKQSIEQGFAEIAKMQTSPLMDTTSKGVLRWLANIKESWLLILDNCDDNKIDFAAYMPSRAGSVIVTTRLTECKDLGTWANLDDLGSDAAMQLLLGACGYELGNQEAHMPAAKAVVSSLGQHALALVHAGAYIKKGLCTLDEYLHLFRKEQARLIKFKPQQQTSRYGSVYATFEVSADALASSADHDCELALRLLNILAFLNREAVEEDIFSRAFDECHKLEQEWERNGMQCSKCATELSIEHDRFTKRQSRLDTLEPPGDDKHVACKCRTCLADISDDTNNGLPESYVYEDKAKVDEYDGDESDKFSRIDHLHIWHCEKVQSSKLVEHQTTTRLRIARTRLAELSLIRIDDNKISMHPLVHEWARTRLHKTAHRHAWEQTVSLLALSAVDDMQWYWFTPRLAPHIDTCFHSRGQEEGQSRLSLTVKQALYRLAWRLYHDRKYQPSLAIFETLSFSSEIQPHTCFPEVYDILDGKSWCLVGLGRHEEARDLANDMVQSKEKRYGRMSSEALDSQLRLAHMHKQAGDNQGALTLLEPLYERWPQLSVLDDSQMERLLLDLMVAHKNLGNFKQARVVAEKNFELWRMDPPDSRRRLKALAMLCAQYINVGQAQKAVTSLEDAINLHYETSALNSSWVKILMTLAQAYNRLKKPNEAMLYLAEARCHLAKLPTENIHPPWFAGKLGLLATTYLDLGEVGLAATLLETRIDLEASYLPAHDTERLLTLRELAQFHIGLGDSEKYKQAVEMLEDVIDKGRETLHTDVKELEITEQVLAEARKKLAQATETPQSVVGDRFQ